MPQSKSTELCSSAAVIPQSKSTEMWSSAAPFHHDLWYFRHWTNQHFCSILFIRKGWRMVPRKTWVSENFGPISKSRQRFLRVSKSCFRVFFCASESRIFFTDRSRSLGFSYFVVVWFSEVEFFRVQGYILWKWASKLRQCCTIRILDYIYLLDHLLMTRVLRFPLTKKVVTLDLKWRGVLFLK